MKSLPIVLAIIFFALMSNLVTGVLVFGTQLYVYILIVSGALAIALAVFAWSEEVKEV